MPTLIELVEDKLIHREKMELLETTKISQIAMMIKMKIDFHSLIKTLNSLTKIIIN